MGAPERPADPLFQLEATTVEALPAPAAELGNAVLAKLRSLGTASILKVRRAKMCVKAEVLRPSVFTVKACIYRMPDGRHSVEFRRCSGDGMAFAQFFRSAAADLGVQLEESLHADTAPQHALPRGLAPPPEWQEASLQPLFDMLMLTQARHLQTEAVAALICAAAELRWAEELAAQAASGAFERAGCAHSWPLLQALAVC
eukprot:NODE_632_length_1435_cov_844.184783.p1 GENE.NODE_632_length_1435_cov_844.184783~~NODE_632_length_1435_cov_844.184783.p1  ORF type:complete len:201 (+),score=52.23 NODE_632_length_1435_cov_844.184783:3-605(+)